MHQPNDCSLKEEQNMKKLITNANVFNGTDNKLVENVSVLIEDNLIIKIGDIEQTFEVVRRCIALGDQGGLSVIGTDRILDLGGRLLGSRLLGGQGLAHLGTSFTGRALRRSGARFFGFKGIWGV